MEAFEVCPIKSVTSYICELLTQLTNSLKEIFAYELKKAHEDKRYR